jgi:hypothetical protein
MQLRVVAIPLLAAICLGSPAMANPEDQMVNGRGARDRSADNSGGGDRRDGAAATPRGGGDRSSNERRRDDGERVAVRAERPNDDGEQRRVARAADRDRENNRAGGNNRSGRDDGQRYAVPRPSSRYNPPIIVRRDSRPNININIGSSRYYAPYYYDRWARSYYRWSPLGYAPWSLIYGSIGFSNYGYYGAYGSPYPYAPYVYGAPWQASGYDIGGIRLRIQPRNAQVFVDGYYAGVVDDFDGTFQSLRLEQGGHKIEVHMPGYEDLELDVHVQPGRTITLQENLRPRP